MYNHRNIYIASCLFTARLPETSLKVQEYISAKPGMDMARCCIPQYKVRENEERVPDNAVRAAWKALPAYMPFREGDTVYSVCHNCTNIIDEQHPGVRPLSLWEYIDADADFAFPDYTGLTVTVQDCWRTRERRGEQEAVRSLLRKLHINVIELPDNFEKTDFCGCTLYREQPEKNKKFAPKHYVEQATGKFVPHTVAEQTAIMLEYCRRYQTKTVVCFCHYCLEGLLVGGVDGRHLAQLLFP